MCDNSSAHVMEFRLAQTSDVCAGQLTGCECMLTERLRVLEHCYLCVLHSKLFLIMRTIRERSVHRPRSLCLWLLLSSLDPWVSE